MQAPGEGTIKLFTMLINSVILFTVVCHFYSGLIYLCQYPVGYLTHLATPPYVLTTPLVF
jgi:hypothetical protein